MVNVPMIGSRAANINNIACTTPASRGVAETLCITIFRSPSLPFI